ncbi:MAG: hypothetical protein FJ288_01580 [Planctomycetes bacterium]|nr:hypothetical protein [Planctomycetota bacterium]
MCECAVGIAGRLSPVGREEPSPAQFRQVLNDLLGKWREAITLDVIQSELVMLKEKVASLEQHRPLVVPLETLAPEPYCLVAPISVVVRAEQDEYVASWYEASLAASGCTPEEAVANLKDIIVAVYESLRNHGEERMGPAPLRQYRLLTKYIAKSD